MSTNLKANCYRFRHTGCRKLYFLL